jgi:Phage integrase family
LDYSHWRLRVWLPACAKAELEGTGFHDLRRANATQLVWQGVDVKTAQTRLGHSDPRLTLAVYAQAVSEADRAAAERLGETFLPIAPKSRAHAALRRACTQQKVLVEVTGLEPAASALRTLRSTN